METDYITPSADCLVFSAANDYFGYIEDSLYKQYAFPSPDGCTYVGCTFATSFASAVNRLHEWIVEHPYIIDNYPKSKFVIEYMDGTISKNNDPLRVEVYSITARKAKKFLL